MGVGGEKTMWVGGGKQRAQGSGQGAQGSIRLRNSFLWSGDELWN